MRQVYVHVPALLRLFKCLRINGCVEASGMLARRMLQRDPTDSLEPHSTFVETIVDVKRLTGGNSTRGAARIRAVVGRLRTQEMTRARSIIRCRPTVAPWRYVTLLSRKKYLPLDWRKKRVRASTTPLFMLLEFKCFLCESGLKAVQLSSWFNSPINPFVTARSELARVTKVNIRVSFFIVLS